MGGGLAYYYIPHGTSWVVPFMGMRLGDGMPGGADCGVHQTFGKRFLGLKKVDLII